MKLHQAHDKLFKETFGDVEVAQDFLQHYLPVTLLQCIDVTSLKMLNESFIEEKLLDSRSDLLYETIINGEKAYVYFLFEHKSYPTKDIALQLLGYMLDIWKRELDKNKSDVLPLIMPLVIYHGRIRWIGPKLLRDWMFNYDELSEDMTKYVPDFEFTLYDFSYVNELDVKGEPKLRAYLQLMQHIFLKDWAKLIQVIVEIETLLLSRGYEKYFNTIILYILRSQENVPVDAIQRELTEEGRKRFMTTAEELIRKGELRGKAEGKIEGKMERDLEIIKNALQMNMDKKQIVQLTGLPLDEIEKIAREVEDN